MMPQAGPEQGLVQVARRGVADGSGAAARQPHWRVVALTGR